MKRRILLIILVVLICLELTTTPQASETKSVNLTRIEAESGDRKAMFNLAMIYFRGTTVTQNFEKALMWFQKTPN